MKTKKQFKYFTIMEYEKEQIYLQNMHKSGWKFVRVSGLGVYHFVESTPEDVIYQLDYNQEGLANKAEYVQMFNDCGWEYIQDYAGYCYFRKSASQMNGDEEIFCDEQSRVQMMERVFKGRLLPLVILFSCVLIPQFILNVFGFHNYIVGAFMGGIIVLYLAVFGAFGIQYLKYKRNATKK